MQPEIKTLSEKKLIGLGSSMSLVNNKTHVLWQDFMQSEKRLKTILVQPCIQFRHTTKAYFSNFNPNTVFKKWAAIEVTDFNSVPDAMEKIILPAGLYAIFLHKSATATATQTFQYIFQTWLPGANVQLDNRPHFEMLGEKYKNNHRIRKKKSGYP